MRQNHRHGFLISAGLVLIVGSLSAFAAAPEIEQIMKERHENFEHMGEAFEDIDREIKRASPDIGRIQRHAGQIDVWAQDQIHWFPVGSGPESGIKTDAKAEIWERPTEFKALQDEFVIEARELKNIADNSPVDMLAAQIHKTGEVCSQCHETYRKKFSLFSIFGF